MQANSTIELSLKFF